ncbi:DUF1295 domain-containing protein [Gordonia jinghuaiqii]|uniref:DUF1295 domain-containing protein n=1 Tax=Gordonia jinghuaiqii TaxID=2758710 RepID=A0A7D7R0N1_9ACTN|nr:DUF1295 domain-containing protein [Gordonia jinghuaiqii]MCR5976625.1 DUF1295 domain-containing protein [Gordonia jinghuaiqii]QMS99811.1 DUF1295 domain-containing protein [Gordonia jinghuaiqii]
MQDRNVSRTASFVRVALAYLVAFGVAAAWLAWGPETGRMWLDTFIADLLATLVIFGFSRAFANSSMYDAYWSVVPPALLLYWWAAGDAGLDAVHCWVIAAVVTVWAVRLTANWASGWPGLQHEDWRYPMLKARGGRAEFLVDLVAIHLVPTVQVFAGMIPVYIAVTHPGETVVWLTVVAAVVGLAAVALEYGADAQLRRFTAHRRPGAVLDTGLWAWSRHPNYFGEFLFWVSMALFGIAASPGDWWWLCIGAVAMAAMFLGASIPMMEARSLERRPGYQDVVDRVPRFIPRRPREPRAPDQPGRAPV